MPGSAGKASLFSCPKQKHTLTLHCHQDTIDRASVMDHALQPRVDSTDLAPSLSAASYEDLTSFRVYLASSSRVLLFLGAGLSAPSGIPTFRGPNTSWRGLSPRDISSPYFLEENPVLFWHHFNHRRSMAMKARPNAGHSALMESARRWGKNCLAVNQNIDGELEISGKHRAWQKHS